LLDGNLRSIAPNRIVSEGQKLLHREPEITEPPVSSEIHLIYQSDNWLVLDKPAPLPVHACGRYFKNTLEAAMQHAYHPEKIRLVHRLDANTSGLLIAARRTTAARYLQKQFSDRAVEKTYLAAVSGHPPEDRWDCQIPISDQTGPLGSRSIAPVDSLQPTHQALTTFQVLHRRSDGTSLLEAIPKTGRTNQIRIHLWESGFPIIGDPLYLPARKLGDGSTLPIDQPSMQLHSWKISLLDPETKTRRSFISHQVPQWAANISG
jgi:RluA family pseudouridine synthase